MLEDRKENLVADDNPDKSKLSVTIRPLPNRCLLCPATVAEDDVRFHVKIELGVTWLGRVCASCAEWLHDALTERTIDTRKE